jgi:hypothetical protein
MINPYYIYILTFGTALFVYQLGWSDLYPTLSLELFLFLIMTFVICLFIGNKIYKPIVKNFYSIQYNTTVANTSYFILVLWGIEFIYNKGIPLFLITTQGVEYDYTSFGIPSLHVFVSTFSSFLIVYTFHLYVSSKNKKVLTLFFINNIPQILLFSRGAVLINIVSCLFIYLLSIKDLLNFNRSLKIFANIMVSLSLLLFLFGSAGNIRSENAYVGRENIILEIGGATQSFRDSFVPPEFLWAYLYISSPLANLQATINTTKDDGNLITIDKIFSFVNSEIFPDFISKRTNELYNHKITGAVLIDPALTVSTVYARSYSVLSWIGMFLMALFIFAFPIFYNSLLKEQNPFNLTGIAILQSLYVFSIFDNMFIFSGLSMQLIYPLIFQLFARKKRSFTP